MESQHSLHFPSDLHVLAYMGLLILLAMVMGRLANLFRLPKITGFLLSGIFLGPSVIGLLSNEIVDQKLGLITDIALAVISFSIGGSIRVDKLKKIGNCIAWVTFSQALVAFILTTIILSLSFFLFLPEYHDVFWQRTFPVAMVLGTIAIATAPGAILAIIQEYHAKGPFTDILLGVVAIDDAICLVFYGIVTAFIKMPEMSFSQGLAWGLSLSLLTILISLGLGGFLGIIRRYLHRFFPQPASLFGVVVGFLFLTTGLAHSMGASPLLAAMTLGIVVGNYVEGHEAVFKTFEEIEVPIFALFFALAGAYMDFSVLEFSAGFALIYFVSRFLGKYSGAWLGAKVSESPDTVKKYLGLGLLPQAGVSVGLILNAQSLFQDADLSQLMVNMVIATTILNELVTPFLVHSALVKAGEVTQPKSFHLRHL